MPNNTTQLPLNLRAIRAALVAVQAGASRRTLTLSDAAQWLTRVRKALTFQARAGCGNVSAYLHGGAVTNNYGYRAESTQLVLNPPTVPGGEPTVAVFRGPAKSGPHGAAVLDAVRFNFVGATPEQRRRLRLDPGRSYRSF